MSAKRPKQAIGRSSGDIVTRVGSRYLRGSHVLLDVADGVTRAVGPLAQLPRLTIALVVDAITQTHRRFSCGLLLDCFAHMQVCGWCECRQLKPYPTASRPCSSTPSWQRTKIRPLSCLMAVIKPCRPSAVDVSSAEDGNFTQVLSDSFLCTTCYHSLQPGASPASMRAAHRRNRTHASTVHTDAVVAQQQQKTSAHASWRTRPLGVRSQPQGTRG